MAVEIERLVATLEANFNKYDKALNKALGNTNRQFTAIETRGKQMEQRLSNIGGGISKAFVGAFAGAVSIRGAQQLIDAATKIDNALKVAGLSGEELDRVYERLYASAQKNAAPIESLVQLYGRASLVQKELGISTEELLGFTDKVALALRVSGQSAAESSGALLQLSQALGSGVVRAEEFSSILEGALPIAQAAAAGLKEAGGSVAALRGLVVDGKISSEAFFRAFEAGSAMLEQKVQGSVLTIDQRFSNFQNTLIDTARDFNKNADAGKLVGGELDALAKGVRELADEFIALGAWIQPVTQYLNDLDDAASNVARTIGSFLGLPKLGAALGVDTINDQTWNFEQTWKDIDKTTAKANELQAALNKAAGGGASATGSVTPVSLTDFAAPDSKKKGSKRTPEDRWNSEIQQWQQRAQALRLDTELVGKSTYEIERRRAALELEQTLEKQGLALTPQRQQQIQSLSEAYAAQVVQLEKVSEAQQRIDDASRESFEAVKSGWMDAITGAESFQDALAGVLKRLAEIAASRAFDALFMPSTGGVGGGLFGGVFGSIGKIFGFAGGGYTGAGGRNEPAGVVHRGEYVMPKSTVDRVGVGALAAIDRGTLPGYAKGGLVGVAPSGAADASPTVVVNQTVNITGPIDASMRGYFDGALADMKARATSGAVSAIREGLRRNPRFLNA
jgi:tape measure domain-containing protein